MLAQPRGIVILFSLMNCLTIYWILFIIFNTYYDLKGDLVVNIYDLAGSDMDSMLKTFYSLASDDQNGQKRFAN